MAGAWPHKLHDLHPNTNPQTKSEGDSLGNASCTCENTDTINISLTISTYVKYLFDVKYKSSVPLAMIECIMLQLYANDSRVHEFIISPESWKFSKIEQIDFFNEQV